MPCRLNLPAAVRYIHWAPPTDLNGLFQAVEAKCKALGIAPGRRVTPDATSGDPSVNVRGILQFVAACELPTEGDSEAEAEAKKEANNKLARLYGTLQARLGAANHTPPAAEPEAAAPPLAAATPDPKPLA